VRVRSRRPIATALALLVAIVVAAGCGGTETPEAPDQLPPGQHPAAVPDGFFGVNGQGLRPLAEDGRLDLLGEQLDRIAAGGIDFIRANIDWTRLEPAAPRHGRHSYEFGGLDAWVNALAERGLRWQLQVVGVPTPQWAATAADAPVCGARAAPARAADVAALSDALARRYGRGGSFWDAHPDLAYEPVTEYELWNEENYGSFWCPIPHPGAYAELADLSARAIHGVDAQAEVVLGGLAGFRDTRVGAPGGAAHISSDVFLRHMLVARPELVREIDVVAVHAYGHDPAGVLSTVAFQRRAVDASALRGKPLSVNEVGWYTAGVGPDVTSEETRADYMGEVTHDLAESDCGILSLAPHTWITAETDPANPEDWYGIADPETGEPYPSGVAYIEQVLLFEGRADEAPPTTPTQVCAAP
jgi:hypothetical protein